MKEGKLPPDQLQHLVLDRRGAENEKVIVGPSLGEDSAVIAWDAPYLVVCSDPVTGASQGAGALLVDINVNDLACKGAEPLYMVTTLIVPPSGGAELIDRLTLEISRRAAELGVAVVGGHTEVSGAYSNPVLSATLIGACDRPMKMTDLRAGDLVLVTKSLGLEGLSILASDRPDLLAPFTTEAERDELRGWRNQISVLPESRLLRPYARLMHDPTEGGFDGGLYEVTRACGLGVELDRSSLPVHPLTKRAAEHLGFEPSKLIASGALLAFIPPEYKAQVEAALEGSSVPWAWVGTMVEGAGNVPPSTKEELWGLLARGVRSEELRPGRGKE